MLTHSRFQFANPGRNIPTIRSLHQSRRSNLTGTPTGGAPRSARMTNVPSPAPTQMSAHRPTQPTVGADVPYLPRRGIPQSMRAKPQHVHGDQGREDQVKVRQTLFTMATSATTSQKSTRPEDAINYDEDSGILVDGVPAGQSLSMKMRSDDSRMTAFFGAPAQPRSTTFDQVNKIGRGSRAPMPYSRTPTAVYKPISMKDDLMAKYARPQQRPTFKNKIGMSRRMDSPGLPAFTSLKTSNRATLPAGVSPPSPIGGRMARAATTVRPQAVPGLADAAGKVYHHTAPKLENKYTWDHVSNPDQVRRFRRSQLF